MPLGTQLCGTWVYTLKYHVRNTTLTQPQLLTYLFFFSSLAFSFVSYPFKCGFLFFLSFVKLMRDGRPQLLTHLFFFFVFFFSLFKHRQIVFTWAFDFVSYSSRCGFLIFLSFVRLMWDGRPQLLTYLSFFFFFFFFFFFSLFKHRQIVFSWAFNFVSYSSRHGFLIFLSFVRLKWDGRPQLLTSLIIYLFIHCLNTGK